MPSAQKSKWLPVTLIVPGLVGLAAIVWPLSMNSSSATVEATPAAVAPATPVPASTPTVTPESVPVVTPTPLASPTEQELTPTAPEPSPAKAESKAPTKATTTTQQQKQETRAPATKAAAPAKQDGNGKCTNTNRPITKPTRFVVSRMGVDVPMMNVGKDENGKPGAPPKSAAYAVAWYNRSSEVASKQGNVMLTAHTYRNGQALGNDLVKGLQPGDVIKISDKSGAQACYTYTGKRKVDVKTYDAKSGWFYNPTGPAQLALMVCWDRNPATGDWDSRYIFYAALQPI